MTLINSRAISQSSASGWGGWTGIPHVHGQLTYCYRGAFQQWVHQWGMVEYNAPEYVAYDREVTVNEDGTISLGPRTELETAEESDSD